MLVTRKQGMPKRRPVVIPGGYHVRGGDVHRGAARHLAPQAHAVGDVARRHMGGAAGQGLRIDDE